MVNVVTLFIINNQIDYLEEISLEELKTIE